MAFLDNSGDIILDAVLTKAGREALANGNFSIEKFSLGDDEINYAQYDASHPSGSAYYDLEILQTPILEGFTQINANINYGLLTLDNDELLYMPEMKTLEKDQLKTAAPDMGMHISVQGANGIVFYVSANQETRDKLRESGALPTGFNSDGSTDALQGEPGDRLIYVETGMRSADAGLKTSAGRSSFASLIDDRFVISVDNRFISNVIGFTGTTTALANSTTNNAISTNPVASTATLISTTTRSQNLMNYNDYEVGGAANQIYTPDTGNATDYTSFNGPGLSLTGFSFAVNSSLTTQSTGARSTLYTDHGKTAQRLSGTSKRFDFIDTMVHVTGRTSGRVISVPVRIIRYVSAS